MTRTVLHLIDTGGPGGAETIYAQVALGLDRARWRSVLAVPERDWLYHELERGGGSPRLLEARGSFNVRLLGAILRLVRRERVSLIHAHLFASGVYASLAGRLAGVPVVCTLHGRVDVEHGDPYLGAKLRILDSRRNRVVFVSDSLRRWYADTAPLRLAQMHVLHNGIDAAAFAPGRDAGLRAELGLAEGEILVGAVGNIRPAKDYATLLQAVALLRGKAIPRLRFVIVGAGGNDLERALVLERARLGLEDSVAFAGFREDVPAVLRALDIYVSSSSSEGFSLTTVQAMACGLPVLATRCGGPEEIVEDGATGLLVGPSSAVELANGIARLAADGPLRARLARAARAAVETRFALPRMVMGYERIYEWALGLRPAAAGESLTSAPVGAIARG